MPGCVSLVALGVALVVVDDLQEDMAEKLRLVAVERLVDVVLALVLVDEFAGDVLERMVRVLRCL